MQRLKWCKSKAVPMIDATHFRVYRDGANPVVSQQKQGMNHTQHQLHAVVDARCQPQALILTAGIEAEVSHAPTLLENLEVKQVILDKAYDSDALRGLIKG